MNENLTDLLNSSRMKTETIDPEKLVKDTAKICIGLIEDGIIGSNISLEYAINRIQKYFNI